MDGAEYRRQRQLFDDHVELAAKLASKAKLLLNTDDALLVEGNDWGDTFWGVCDGVGDNWLGWLLMAQRAYLRSL